MAIEQLILDLKHTIYTPVRERMELRPGAQKLINGLEMLGLPYVFCINSATMSAEQLAFRLSFSGLYINPKQIVSPVQTSIEYLKREGIDYVNVVSCNEELIQQYRHGGLALIRAFEPHMQGRGAVVVAYDSQLNAASMKTAINYAAEKQAQLVALNGKLFRTTSNGKREYDALSTARFIAYSAGISPDAIKIIGKPSEEYFRTVLLKYLPFNSPLVTAVLGDSPSLDLATPKQMGMTTFFVSSPHLKSLESKHSAVVDYQLNCLDEALGIIGGLIRTGSPMD
jgi:ribonucleotide monophosphatase NagD (HAD superfamily)